ncbi:MAG: hypothetical protein HY717_13755 [Planctomycetes bacterium]|nr:hypothetical protein [Planctomycetota bacterium]
MEVLTKNGLLVLALGLFSIGARPLQPADCNGNGIPDPLELGSRDCNMNFTPDECDLAAGTSRDDNSNGVPDECDPPPPPPGSFVRGDATADERIDISDPTAILSEWTNVGYSVPCRAAASVYSNPACCCASHPGTDPAGMIEYLFKGGRPPDPPFPSPGLTWDYCNRDECVWQCIPCNRYPVPPPPPQASFSLGFEGCPAEVSGTTGEVKTFEVVAVLTTSGNLVGTRGAQSWSFSLGAENLKVVSVTIAGTDAAALKSFRTVAEVVDPGLDRGAGPQGPGAVSAVMLDLLEGVTLPAEGTARIARITAEAVVPEQPSQARLFFVDGKKGSGLPVENVVTFENASHFPSLGSCTINLHRTAGGLQLPGDCNQDGELDQSDAICILSYVFLGGPPEVLPCGDGGSGDPANIFFLNFNDDQGLDQSDAIGILMWKFLGGAPHFRGTACVTIPGCPDNAALCKP